MKKLISCLLAVALVFSLMGVSVFAGTTAHPNNQNPSSNEVTAGTQYWVVGAQDDNSDDIGKGVTGFGETGVTADVNVNFKYNATTEDVNGNPVEDTFNVIESRYAIDIVYKDLTLDLGTLTTTETHTAQGTIREVTYKFVWDVNTHKYVMVNAETNEVVYDGVTNVNQSIDIDQEVVIKNAFYIINHSDKAIDYTADIAVVGYSNVLYLGIDSAEDTDLDTQTIAKCFVDASGVSSGAQNTDATTAHNIVATPKTDWITTVGALHAQGNDKTKVGTITIKVLPNDRNDIPAANP